MFEKESLLKKCDGLERDLATERKKRLQSEAEREALRGILSRTAQTLMAECLDADERCRELSQSDAHSSKARHTVSAGLGFNFC